VGAAALVLRDQVDYDYEPPPEKREPISARVPASLKARLLAVVRLWKAQAKARGDDPELVDLSHVVERLLKTGVDGVWSRMEASAGIDGPPKTEIEWTQLEKLLHKAAAETPKKK
jgi:hypothetical protein